jgi:hypothetical protein
MVVEKITQNATIYYEIGLSRFTRALTSELSRFTRASRTFLSL